MVKKIRSNNQLIKGIQKVLLKRSNRRALFKIVLQCQNASIHRPLLLDYTLTSFLVLGKPIDHLCCKYLSRVCTFLFNLVLTAIIKFCTYHQLFYSSTATGCQPRSTVSPKRKERIGLKRESQNESAETTGGGIEARQPWGDQALSSGEAHAHQLQHSQAVGADPAVEGMHFLHPFSYLQTILALNISL